MLSYIGIANEYGLCIATLGLVSFIQLVGYIVNYLYSFVSCRRL